MNLKKYATSSFARCNVAPSKDNIASMDYCTERFCAKCVMYNAKYTSHMYFQLHRLKRIVLDDNN